MNTNLQSGIVLLKSFLFSLSYESQKPCTNSVSFKHDTVGLLKCSIYYLCALVSAWLRKPYDLVRGYVNRTFN